MPIVFLIWMPDIQVEMFFFKSNIIMNCLYYAAFKNPIVNEKHSRALLSDATVLVISAKKVSLLKQDFLFSLILSVLSKCDFESGNLTLLFNHKIINFILSYTFVKRFGKFTPLFLIPGY
ncbi:hypothetical protein RhiirC2_415528 [Rhizophagus irregularis]|uniref:Uncharacterized protein n=1 Tax=Rhizophagus irregularis TaxID=588596 RepID=A0A2N1P3V6_9GLOM|nr:hypothetical protein RhiirC2_415528 [Rhizophagus irregularis]